MVSAEEVHKTQNSEGGKNHSLYLQCFQTSVELLVAPADLSVSSMRRRIEQLCRDRGDLVNELIVIKLLTCIQ